MAEQSKVIPIKTKKPSAGSISSRIETRKVLIKKINAMGVKFLKLRLATLFNNVDEYFFDRSGESLVGLDSRVVFDAMRELRSQRDIVEKHLAEDLIEQFQKLCKKQLKENADDIDADSLSLVDEESLEKSVSIKNIVASAIDNNRKQLTLLQSGLGNLLNVKEMSDADNPLGPEFICNSFLAASNSIDVDIKIVLILFKHFERIVVKHLPKLYDASVDLLATGGYVDKKFAKRKIVKSGVTQSDEEDKYPEVNLLEAIQSIMALNCAINLPVANLKKRYTNLSGELTHQGLLQQISVSGEQLLSDKPVGLANIVPALINAIFMQSQKNIPRADEDVINLAAMFFEFILKDKNQPERVRALVSELQLPILKLAMNEPNFFSQKNHPARRLINLIAKAGFGIADSKKEDCQKIYSLLEDIIKTISTHKGVYDKKLFAREEKRLSEFLARDDHRLKLIEKRLAQAEAGKAKLESGEKVVAQCIQASLEKLSEAGLPIRRFVEQDWKKVLLQTVLKEGEDSVLWKSRSDALVKLTSLSNVILQGKDDAQIESGFNTLAAAMLKSLEDTALESNAKDILFKDFGLFCAAVGMDRDKEIEKQVTPQATVAPRVVENIVKPYVAENAASEPLTEEFVKKAKDMSIGQWVEISSNADNTSFTRCKLIAKIDLVDRYVFIDHLGRKVAELNQNEVATSLQSDSLKVLNSAPLVERAMTCITNTIKKTAEKELTVDEQMAALVS